MKTFFFLNEDLYVTTRTSQDDERPSIGSGDGGTPLIEMSSGILRARIPKCNPTYLLHDHTQPRRFLTR